MVGRMRSGRQPGALGSEGRIKSRVRLQRFAFVLALVITLLLGVPAIAAQGDFGEILTPTAPDAVPTLTQFPIGVPSLCYVDTSGDTPARYDPGESAYLVFDASCPATLPSNSLRLVPAGAHPGGTLVRAGDADANRPLEKPFGFRFAFRDANGDGRFNADDAAYLAVCNTGACPPGTHVAPGWIRMTATPARPAGTIVQAGDLDVGHDTTQGSGTYFQTPFTAGHFLFWDLGADGTFAGDDILYWRTGGTGNTPGPNWIRLGKLSGTGDYGQTIVPGQVDAVPSLMTFSVGVPKLCYVDESGDTPPRYDVNEAAYLVFDTRCPATLPVNAMRLTAMDPHEPGSRVHPAHADHNRPLQEPHGFRFVFHDANNDGRFNVGDVAYLGICNPGTCPPGPSVAPGWIRLSASAAYPAGTIVAVGDNDMGKAVIQGDGTHFGAPLSGGHILYWDIAADGTFGAEDLVYWRTNGVAMHPSANWIRLSHLQDGRGYGEILRPGHPDAVPSLMLFPTNVPRLCWSDASGDTPPRYDAGEPVYLVFSSTCPASLPINSLRLLPVGTSAGGSWVRPSDSDMGAGLREPDGFRFSFHDANSDGRFNHGDTAYLALCNMASCPVPATVAAGWIRLSTSVAGPAMNLLSPGAVDIGRTTTQGSGTYFLSPLAGAHILYWDLAADGVLGTEDIVYWRTSGVGTHPLANWIRLGAAMEPIQVTSPVKVEDPAVGGDDVPPGVLEPQDTQGAVYAPVLVALLAVLGLGSLARRDAKVG